MFITALLIMAKKWKQPKRSSADEQITKSNISVLRYIAGHETKYNNDICHIFLNLENAVLNEKNVTEFHIARDTIHMKIHA